MPNQSHSPDDRDAATLMWIVVGLLIVALGVWVLNAARRPPRAVPVLAETPAVIPAPVPQWEESSARGSRSQEYSPAFLQMAFGDNPILLEQIQTTLAQTTNLPSATVPASPVVDLIIPASVASLPAPSYRYAKHFTVEEARSLLPELRRMFAGARAARDRLEEAHSALNPQFAANPRLRREDGAATTLRQLAVLKHCAHQIEKMGAVIEDLEGGVLGFPHLRGGQEVLLSWALDEDDIEFWHPLDVSWTDRERL